VERKAAALLMCRFNKICLVFKETALGIPRQCFILLARHARFEDKFGERRHDQHLFPWGKPVPADPYRHATDTTWGGDQLRKSTGVSCRIPNLRHTFATRLAENGVPESTMLALMGHMSRSMLERYSHIRMAAKRDAVAGVSLSGRHQNSEAVPVKVPVLTESGFIQ
jgi:integrase